MEINKEFLKDGIEFTIHGGIYRRCSGAVSYLEFNIPDVKRRPGESEDSWYSRLGLAEKLEIYKKFSNKSRTLRQIKIMTEEMMTGLNDPIKYEGCIALKIHYTTENPNIFHWV